MYLVKEITTGYGFPASIWDINSVTVKRTGLTYTASGSLSIYYSNDKRLEGGAILDNCLFNLSGLSQSDIDGNTSEAIFTRIMESKVVEGVETNKFSTSLSGEVTFVDAQIVEEN
jgi:hypothetical protein